MSENNPEQVGPEAKMVRLKRETRDIYGGKDSKLSVMLKKAATERGDGTNQGVVEGVVSPLIDKLTARELRDFNSTHSICIDAKTSATVGMGHRDEKIHETLDPLCDFSWQDVLDALAEDFWETGECFLEVVRGDDDKSIITGLHHLESAQVQPVVELEDNPNDIHYAVSGKTGEGEVVSMARFGELEELRKRFPDDDTASASATKGRAAIGGKIVDSEIVHMRQATNRSRLLGYPDYMAAVPSIELVQCMTQHEFDFYFNRGVPEFLMFVIGRNLGKSWTKIEEMFQAQQGLGNSHKTAAFHIPGSKEEVGVQVEKLAMEDSGNTGFSEKSDTLAMQIATAHGMPPLLANIQISGKMGGNNEGPNALMLFQKRKLGKAQRNFSTILACSLGQEGQTFAMPDGSKAKVTRDQFMGTEFLGRDEESGGPATDDAGLPIFMQPGNGFKTVLDGMSFGAMETMSTMRETVAGSQRDLNDGKLESQSDRKPGDTTGKGTRGGPPA